MSNEYEEIRSRVIAWTREAGALARERLGHSIVSRKADQSVVTDADLAVQEMLLAHIGREFSSDAAITEETQKSPHRHASPATARRCWVIDPIDGTRNYARGFPLFSVVAALMEEGRPVVGVIHNPMTGEMYSASLDAGAWWDERRLKVRDEPLSAGSIIAVPSSRQGPLAGFLHRWMDRTILRNVGSTALHLALVASGAIDASFADDCRLWDVAAGALIAAEAGAVVVTPEGRPPFPVDLAGYCEPDVAVLAAGPRLAGQLLADIAAERN
jgi:myo-inositol-1(or 4)-monophosphatase